MKAGRFSPVECFVVKALLLENIHPEATRLLADAGYEVENRRGALGGELLPAGITASAVVVTTPGSGFGPAGESYMRFSAFGHRADVEEACARLAKLRL